MKRPAAFALKICVGNTLAMIILSSAIGLAGEPMRAELLGKHECDLATLEARTMDVHKGIHAEYVALTENHAAAIHAVADAMRRCVRLRKVLGASNACPETTATGAEGKSLVGDIASNYDCLAAGSNPQTDWAPIFDRSFFAVKLAFKRTERLYDELAWLLRVAEAIEESRRLALRELYADRLNEELLLLYAGDSGEKSAALESVLAVAETRERVWNEIFDACRDILAAYRKTILSRLEAQDVFLVDVYDTLAKFVGNPARRNLAVVRRLELLHASDTIADIKYHHAVAMLNEKLRIQQKHIRESIEIEARRRELERNWLRRMVVRLEENEYLHSMSELSLADEAERYELRLAESEDAYARDRKNYDNAVTNLEVRRILSEQALRKDMAHSEARHALPPPPESVAERKTLVGAEQHRMGEIRAMRRQFLILGTARQTVFRDDRRTGCAASVNCGGQRRVGNVDAQDCRAARETDMQQKRRAFFADVLSNGCWTPESHGSMVQEMLATARRSYRVWASFPDAHFAK